MFGVGPAEFLVIAIVAVLFIGPDKLPDMLRKFGRFYVQAKRQANEVKSTFDQAIHEAERDLEIDRIRELQRQLSLTMPSDLLKDESTHHEGTTLDAEHKKLEGESAMPPGEIEAQQEAAHHDDEHKNEGEQYHQGHLPAHQRNEDHDPFSNEALGSKKADEPEESKPAQPAKPAH